TCTTVTGTTRLSSSQTWVMPTLRPTIAFCAMAAFLSVLTCVAGQANAPHRQAWRSASIGCAVRFPEACADFGWRAPPLVHEPFSLPGVLPPIQPAPVGHHYRRSVADDEVSPPKSKSEASRMP